MRVLNVTHGVSESSMTHRAPRLRAIGRRLCRLIRRAAASPLHTHRDLTEASTRNPGKLEHDVIACLVQMMNAFEHPQPDSDAAARHAPRCRPGEPRRSPKRAPVSPAVCDGRPKLRSLAALVRHPFEHRRRQSNARRGMRSRAVGRTLALDDSVVNTPFPAAASATMTLVATSRPRHTVGWRVHILIDAATLMPLAYSITPPLPPADRPRRRRHGR
jgi:hypothetical protein